MMTSDTWSLFGYHTLSRPLAIAWGTHVHSWPQIHPLTNPLGIWNDFWPLTSDLWPHVYVLYRSYTHTWSLQLVSVQRGHVSPRPQSHQTCTETWDQPLGSCDTFNYGNSLSYDEYSWVKGKLARRKYSPPTPTLLYTAWGVACPALLTITH